MSSERLLIKAAVYLILKRDGKVLFCRRANTGWADGKLSLPSGHVEKGELPTIAAVRELAEETGITVSCEQLQIAHIVYRQDIYVDFYYLVKDWTGDPHNAEEEKCSEIVWEDAYHTNDQYADHVLETVQKVLAGKGFFSEYRANHD